MCVAPRALRCQPPLIRGVGRDLSSFAPRWGVEGLLGGRGRPVRSAAGGARGGSSAWGGSGARGRFQRTGRFHARGGSSARDGSTHGAVPAHGTVPANGMRAPQGQISDRFCRITTQSRAQKDRCGRFTAGGWGTARSPKLRPPLGRCPGVLRSRDDLRMSVTLAACGEPRIGDSTSDPQAIASPR